MDKEWAQRMDKPIEQEVTVDQLKGSLRMKLDRLSLLDMQEEQVDRDINELIDSLSFSGARSLGMMNPNQAQQPITSHIPYKIDEMMDKIQYLKMRKSQIKRERAFIM